MKNKWLTAIIIVIIVIVLALIISREPGRDSLVAKWRQERREIGDLHIIYPLNGTLFPPEITPPTFRWRDQKQPGGAWAISVDTGGEEILKGIYTDRQEWRPTREQWETLKLRSMDGDARVTILGLTEKAVYSSASVTIRTSRDEVGAPIFYRDVPLPFKYAYANLERIRWRLGTIDSDQPSAIILENLPLCANCHSFTPDGAMLAMDVDYANDKGSYMIAAMEKRIPMTADKIISWSDYRREDGVGTFGLLSQVSPDGRYIISTVKDRSIFVPKDDPYYSQLFFPIKGILVVYDRQTASYRALPGADDPAYVQSSPAWTPDGQTIYFARAKAYISEEAEKIKSAVLPTSVASEFIEGKRGFKYDLYRIPFNGGGGGTPEPVPGASQNGMSNYFPKISPDGKWLVFTQARNFMLLQPDSKLYIMPASGGRSREMTCNTVNMNSWHSWSPNGKWLVFASKWLGPYTQLYITHIDEHGGDTPPVLLENLTIANRAANIPEFVNIRPGELEKLEDRFTESGNYYVRIGVDKFLRNDVEGAIKAYDKALEQTPGSASLYGKRGDARYKLKDYRKAIDDYDLAIKLNPNYVDAYKGRAAAKLDSGDFTGAREDFTSAIRLKDNDDALYADRAVAKAEMGDLNGAVQDFSRALQLKPSAKIYNRRADVKARLKDFSGAIKDLDEAIRLAPDDHALYNNRGVVKADSGDLDGAIADYGRCIERNPDYALAYRNRGFDRLRLKKFNEADKDLQKALELNPGDFAAHSIQGEIKFELRDFPAALKALNEALRLNPQSADDYYKRGMVKLVRRDREAGCADLHKAHELGSPKAMPQIEKYCGR
jgi:tetratricopeptide (TPR) repeat protein